MEMLGPSAYSLTSGTSTKVWTVSLGAFLWGQFLWGRLILSGFEGSEFFVSGLVLLPLSVIISVLPTFLYNLQKCADTCYGGDAIARSVTHTFKIISRKGISFLSTDATSFPFGFKLYHVFRKSF